MTNYNRIILNIPHSSLNLSTHAWTGDIQKEVNKWTDFYTDELFAPKTIYGNVKTVIFPYSRFFCDAERLLNDPLEEKGQGIYYTDFNNCHREKTSVAYFEAMSAWYEHQRKLSKRITPNSIVIDCHSFPTELAPDVDICIGFNEDWSKPNLKFIELVASFFESYGYKVKLNNPYGNSITPHHDFQYSSIMIEVNKKLYMTDDLKKNQYFQKLNNIFNYLYENILYTWNY